MEILIIKTSKSFSREVIDIFQNTKAFHHYIKIHKTGAISNYFLFNRDYNYNKCGICSFFDATKIPRIFHANTNLILN